jgi:hypothetical protein
MTYTAIMPFALADATRWVRFVLHEVDTVLSDHARPLLQEMDEGLFGESIQLLTCKL